jgi:hypothetical protein
MQLAHPSVRAFQKLVSSHFMRQMWLHGVSSASGQRRPTRLPPPSSPLPHPFAVFQYIHVDLLGPLLVSCDWFAYLMTVTD